MIFRILRFFGIEDPELKKMRDLRAIDHLKSERLRVAIMRSSTDYNSCVDFGSMTPQIENMVAIFQAASGLNDEQVFNQCSGMHYFELKRKLTDSLIPGMAHQ